MPENCGIRTEAVGWVGPLKLIKHRGWRLVQDDKNGLVTSRFQPDSPDLVPWVTLTDFGCAKARPVRSRQGRGHAGKEGKEGG